MNAPIQTLFFDMGNVLYFFSHEKMCRQMSEVLDCEIELLKEFLFAQEGLNAFERGDVGELEFTKQLCGLGGKDVPVTSLYRANADIFQQNDEMESVLRDAKAAGLRLVLLSNTGPWHYQWICENFSLLELFDDSVLSYAANSLKPEAEIFHFALSRANCPAENCFFTDDLLANITAARAAGFQAEVFETASLLRKQLEQLQVFVER